MLFESRPFSRSLLLIACALTALFVALGPSSSAALPPLTAAGFWFSHIGAGLVLCVLAANWVNRWQRLHAAPAWVAVLVSGVIGSLLFAPIALGLERVVPESAPAAADGLLDRWELAGGLPALAAEWLSLAPEFVMAWLLVNAPPLLARRAAEPVGDPAPPAVEPPSVATPISAAAPVAAQAEPPAGFWARLPPAIGRDLVSVTADLHYLQVVTRGGRATVLGTLDEAERALGEHGLRIHRSHVVALDGVRRVVRKGSQWLVETRAGQKLPVSRRRVADVRARLGSDFVAATDGVEVKAVRH